MLYLADALAAFAALAPLAALAIAARHDAARRSARRLRDLERITRSGAYAPLRGWPADVGNRDVRAAILNYAAGRAADLAQARVEGTTASRSCPTP